MEKQDKGNHMMSTYRTFWLLTSFLLVLILAACNLPSSGTPASTGGGPTLAPTPALTPAPAPCSVSPQMWVWQQVAGNTSTGRIATALSKAACTRPHPAQAPPTARHTLQPPLMRPPLMLGQLLQPPQSLMVVKMWGRAGRRAGRCSWTGRPGRSCGPACSILY